MSISWYNDEKIMEGCHLKNQIHLHFVIQTTEMLQLQVCMQRINVCSWRNPLKRFTVFIIFYLFKIWRFVYHIYTYLVQNTV